MSGLGEMGDFYAANVNALQVQQKDLDQYDIVQIDFPTVNTAWFGAGTSTGTTVHPIVQTNMLPDWPRTPAYAFTGGTSGGTFVANWIDQFGMPVTETVSLGSVAGGGTVYGTVIAAKFVSGTIYPNTSTAGTYTLGLGTVTTGSTQGNWFGLLTKLGGTADVKNITWISTSTATTLNGGTNIGTLVDINRHAFQGTSGVATTDHYKVILKASYDNVNKGTMSAL